MESKLVALDRLLGTLPGVAELAPLRDAILAASMPDPDKTWSHSSVYATMDKRVVEAAQLEAVVDAAKDTALRRVEQRYATMQALLKSAAQADIAGVCDHLVSAGEAAESEEQWNEAHAHYALASRLAGPLADRHLLALSLRRMARVHWNRGEVEEAIPLYTGSLEQAESAADVEGQIVALTGLGNMRSAQGRWADARVHYAAALALCGVPHARLQGQIFLNLANLAREEAQYAESRTWLDRAVPIWDDLGEANQSVWLNNHGLLCMAQRDWLQAEVAFHQALEHAPGHLDRAMLFDNLAELCAERGLHNEALSLARRAEEHALTAGSPWALGIVYTDIGKIFRLSRDPNGFTFFEKALEICRERVYPLVEGQAHLEYGLFRRDFGELDEATSYLQRAVEIFAQLGAGAHLQQARRELDAIGFPGGPGIAAGTV